MMTSSAERLDISLKRMKSVRRVEFKAERIETCFLNSVFLSQFNPKQGRDVAGVLDKDTCVALISSLCHSETLSEKSEPLAEVSEHGFVTSMTHRNT